MYFIYKETAVTWNKIPLCITYSARHGWEYSHVSIAMAPRINLLPWRICLFYFFTFYDANRFLFNYTKLHVVHNKPLCSRLKIRRSNLNSNNVYSSRKLYVPTYTVYTHKIYRNCCGGEHNEVSCRVGLNSNKYMYMRERELKREK